MTEDTNHIHKAVDTSGIVWFQAGTADELRALIANHYDISPTDVEIDGETIREVEVNGMTRSSWRYEVVPIVPTPNTPFFLRTLADRLNDFVAEGFLRTTATAAHPLDDSLAAFLRREENPAAPFTRTEVDIIRTALADVLTEVTS